MFARTDRLLLRPAWPEDSQALAAGLADEAVVRNLLGAPWHDPTRGGGVLPELVMCLRTMGQPALIGGVGLTLLEDGAVALGGWVRRSHWGLGFASEAGSAVIAMARAIGLTTLAALHYADNPGAGRVLRKLGFAPTGGVAMRPAHPRGALVPSIAYRLSLAGCAEPCRALAA